ncbi:MAG: DUF58 domain-containing protein [Planctomycetota bacterium]
MLQSTNRTQPQTIDDLIDPTLSARLTSLDVTSRKVFAGKLKGERRSKRRGESVEFADHRPYVVGDDLRHIDWNIFARLDHLFLKLFMEEEDLSLHLVVDCTASADCGEPSKFQFMQRAAAALGYIGLVNLNRVACTALGERATELEPTSGGVAGSIRDLRGKRRVHDLAKFLCTLQPAGGSDFRAACKRIALTRRGRGVMVVLSDFFYKEGYEDGLRMLVGRGYDVFCIQVLAPQELEPTAPGGVAGDLRLKDMEDADLAEVTISAPLIKRYKAMLGAYCDGLRDFCARREIGMITVSSETEIDTLLLDYLRRRGVVR